MGWDISYHPISSDEIITLYFDGLEKEDAAQTLGQLFNVHEFYIEQMRLRFEEANKIDDSVPFNKGHTFYLAIICGFLRKFHYIRGGAFSFVTDDSYLKSYVSDWATLVPERYKTQHFDNKLTDNYCGGVYIANSELVRLKQDYESNEHVRSALDNLFSHGRIAVFWKAVDEAVDQGLGLLEASEVIEPNPMDLNKSKCLSNLFNCHTDGPILYAETAAQQLSEVMKSSQNQVASTEEKFQKNKKKGFFHWLFKR